MTIPLGVDGSIPSGLDQLRQIRFFVGAKAIDGIVSFNFSRQGMSHFLAEGLMQVLLKTSPSIGTSFQIDATDASNGVGEDVQLFFLMLKLFLGQVEIVFARRLAAGQFSSIVVIAATTRTMVAVIVVVFILAVPTTVAIVTLTTSGSVVGFVVVAFGVIVTLRPAGESLAAGGLLESLNATAPRRTIGIERDRARAVGITRAPAFLLLLPFVGRNIRPPLFRAGACRGTAAHSSLLQL